MRQTLLATVVFCLCPPSGWATDSAGSNSTDSTKSNTAASSSDSIEFRGERLLLAFAHIDGADDQLQIINEYIPANETLDNWTTMVGLYSFPRQRDYRAMAGQLVKLIKQQDPTTNFAIHENEERTRTMVDFLILNRAGAFAEFNIFVYQKSPDGAGVLAQQIALRGYGDNRTSFLTNLKELRPKMLQLATEYQFPELAVPQTLH